MVHKKIPKIRIKVKYVLLKIIYYGGEHMHAWRIAMYIIFNIM